MPFPGWCTPAEQRNRMRTRRCGGKSKCGCVCGQHDFFDANARLDHARKNGRKNQGDDGCCNDPTISASIHDISLASAGRMLGVALFESRCQAKNTPVNWMSSVTR